MNLGAWHALPGPRPELLAAAPPLLLASGTLLSLVWRGLGLRGDLLLFPLPTFLASALVIAGALLGLVGYRRLRRPSWGVFALSTLSYLSVAAVAGDDIVSGGVAVAGVPLAGFLQMGWLVLAMVFAIGVGEGDTRRALWLFALFLSGVGIQFTIRIPQGGAAGDPGLLVTLAMATVVLGESLAVAWAIAAFTRGAERVAFWVLVAVLVAHPLLTTWQVTLQSPGGLSAYVQFVVGTEVLLGVMMAMTFALHRLAVGLRQRMR